MKLTDNKTVFGKFGDWFAKAEAAEPAFPNAMALATVGADGRPSSRMVLLKGWDEDGFVFYTNLDSRKGSELAENPNASLLFYWKSLKRQIRVEGVVHQVSDAEADAYFATRPRDARIGAWASKQSEAMEGRFEFEARIAKFAAKFAVGEVPRPDNWSGFRLVPDEIEFWKERKFRLHERLVYRLQDGGEWREETLYP